MTANTTMLDKQKKRLLSLTLGSKKKLLPLVLPQNKVNLSLIVSSTKIFSSKSSPSIAPKKQFNFLQVDLSSKLASNRKLISNKCKKCLENNLYLYYSAEDYKLDSYLKKQTIVTPKGCSTSATTDTLAAASKKPLEK